MINIVTGRRAPAPAAVVIWIGGIIGTILGARLTASVALTSTIDVAVSELTHWCITILLTVDFACDPSLRRALIDDLVVFRSHGSTLGKLITGIVDNTLQNLDLFQSDSLGTFEEQSTLDPSGKVETGIDLEMVGKILSSPELIHARVFVLANHCSKLL